MPPSNYIQYQYILFFTVLVSEELCKHHRVCVCLGVSHFLKIINNSVTVNNGNKNNKCIKNTNNNINERILQKNPDNQKYTSRSI